MDKASSPLSRAVPALLGFLILALALVPFASRRPDGLEFTAESLAFADRARDASTLRLDDSLGTLPAALAGAVLVGIIVRILFSISNSSRKKHHHGTIRNP